MKQYGGVRVIKRLLALLVALSAMVGCACTAEELEIVSLPVEEAVEEIEETLCPEAQESEVELWEEVGSPAEMQILSAEGELEPVLDYEILAIEQPQSYVVDISSYDAFKRETLGKAFYLDGAYGAQCWDGAALLWNQLGMTLNTGGNNAKGCWLNAREQNAGTQFELIENAWQVRRGDVIVLNLGSNGHIGFADEDYTDGMVYFTVYGQNQGNAANNTEGLPFSVLSGYYPITSFLGAFRYKGWGGMAINAEHFPCAAFREHISESYDTDHNGYLSDAERCAVEYMDLNGLVSINDLTGIGCFENLIKLWCSGCGLSTLDISGCAKLQELDVSDNQLTGLDISQNPNLIDLNCDNNNLTKLDLQQNSNSLCYLQCTGNSIKKLDLDRSPHLLELYNYMKNGTVPRHHTGGIIYYEGSSEMMFLSFDASTSLIVGGKAVDGGKIIIPKAISLNKKGTVTLKMGKTLKLKANMKPKTAMSLLIWKSSNKQVAKVSSSGKVTPKKPGTTVISVSTYNGKRAKLKIKVVPVAPSKVEITKGKKATMKVGGKLQLKAKLTPTVATTSLKWSTSNNKVATVSDKGLIKAIGQGVAIITVKTANGIKAQIKVKVQPKPVELMNYLGKDIKTFAKKYGLKVKKVIFAQTSWEPGTPVLIIDTSELSMDAFEDTRGVYKITNIEIKKRGSYCLYGIRPGDSGASAINKLKQLFKGNPYAYQYEDDSRYTVEVSEPEPDWYWYWAGLYFKNGKVSRVVHIETT